jgi:hypothetical protein
MADPQHAGCLVTLAEDAGGDRAAAILTALRMIKGVADVRPVPADPLTFAVEIRRDAVWRSAIYDLARNGPAGGG